MDVKNLVEGYFYMMNRYHSDKLIICVYIGTFAAKFPQIPHTGPTRYCFALVWNHGENDRVPEIQILRAYEVTELVYEMYDLPAAVPMPTLVGEVRRPVLPEEKHHCHWPDCVDCAKSGIRPLE